MRRLAPKEVCGKVGKRAGAARGTRRRHWGGRWAVLWPRGSLCGESSQGLSYRSWRETGRLTAPAQNPIHRHNPLRRCEVSPPDGSPRNSWAGLFVKRQRGHRGGGAVPCGFCPAWVDEDISDRPLAPLGTAQPPTGWQVGCSSDRWPGEGSLEHRKSYLLRPAVRQPGAKCGVSTPVTDTGVSSRAAKAAGPTTRGTNRPAVSTIRGIGLPRRRLGPSPGQRHTPDDRRPIATTASAPEDGSTSLVDPEMNRIRRINYRPARASRGGPVPRAKSFEPLRRDRGLTSPRSRRRGQATIDGGELDCSIYSAWIGPPPGFQAQPRTPHRRRASGCREQWPGEKDWCGHPLWERRTGSRSRAEQLEAGLGGQGRFPSYL